MPYQQQYPSGHLTEYLAPQKAALLALFLYRRSYHENQLSLFQYQIAAPPQLCPYAPLYNEKPPDHHRPLNQSYPAPQRGYNASSKVAPNSPLRHRLKSHRVGDIYPLLHQRYVRTSLLHVAPSNHFYTLHKGYDGVLGLNHPLHLVVHDR